MGSLFYLRSRPFGHHKVVFIAKNKNKRRHFGCAQKKKVKKEKELKKKN